MAMLRINVIDWERSRNTVLKLKIGQQRRRHSLVFDHFCSENRIYFSRFVFTLDEVHQEKVEDVRLFLNKNRFSNCKKQQQQLTHDSCLSDTV